MAGSGRVPEGDLLRSGRPGAQKTAESEFLFRCYSNPIHDCHHPRKRMIQYAVTVIITLEGRGVLDAPPSRGMTRSGHKKSAGDITSGG
jgi:hypothetical protein